VNKSASTGIHRNSNRDKIPVNQSNRMALGRIATVASNQRQLPMYANEYRATAGEMHVGYVTMESCEICTSLRSLHSPPSLKPAVKRLLRSPSPAILQPRLWPVVCLLVAFCLLLNFTAARVLAGRGAINKHPISITEASMFVTRTKGIARIQMFAEDLILFQGLEPDDKDRIRPDDLKRGLEQHKAFLLEKFSVRDVDGNLVKGQITDMKPFEIPVDGIPSTEMMQHTATYEIEYPFAAPPEFLTIQQDISDANFIVPGEMSLNVHQAGTGLNYTERLMPGGSTTLRFDWEQTLSEDASEEEWDSWFEKQREATLGITSYSSVYSFIYIEPAEVRHEMLIPLATLATIVPIQHQDPAFVEVHEQAAIGDSVRKWLTNENPLLINGVRVLPEFSRIDFYSLNLSDFATQAAAQKVSLASGRVGIIMTYRSPTDVVQDVSLSWNQFYSSMKKIPAVVIAYPDRMDRFEFSRFNTADGNTLAWKCRDEDLPVPVAAVKATIPARPVLAIPIGSIFVLMTIAMATRMKASRKRSLILLSQLAIAAAVWKPLSVSIEHPWKSPDELSSEEATNVFMALHQGIYRSLDFGSEERIYDVLATSVDGNLLEQLYLQLRQSLELREQGGAVARIREITYEHGEAPERGEMPSAWPAFQFRSTWTVAGTVEHWGHVHERQNQFQALFTIEPRQGDWKITRMDMESQTQKSARTTLRKF